MRGETVEAPALELIGITKSFGSVQALRGADFVVRAGEVHALLGENGAGKSTLLHIAFGMTTPDRGTFRVRGREVTLRSPREARALGLGMVHQHFTSVGALTVEENIRLAVGRSGKAAARQAGSAAGALLEGLNASDRVEDLSVASRQRLEIVKALATGARILLLDEPSAVLTPGETEELLALARGFARDGGAVALITHKLGEVFAGADRVTVLRRGGVTLSGSIAGQTEASLAEAMIGAAVRQAGGVAATAVPLRSRAAAAVVAIGPITIHAGELVGVAAVEGNGQREILRALAGLAVEPRVPVSAEGRVAFVPEDRTVEGLIPALSVAENVVLGLGEDQRWVRGIRLDWPAARARTAELIRSFGIQAAGPDARAGTLSGGNQQKVVLARALERGPRVLIAENPTRGLDIRATAEVHDRLRGAARDGVAVIVHSTDLDEVLELGERVLVVHAGRVREAPRDADRRVIGEMMLGLPGER